MSESDQVYNPQRDLMTGFRQGMQQLEMFPWDDYYPRMAQTDFLCGQADVPAVKAYFTRAAPFGGSYILLGGLTAFLRQLHDYRFTDEVCKGLRDMGYKEEWIQFVKKRQRVRVKVYANFEGSVFLGNEPAVILVGSIHDLRLAEGMLLPNINFPSLLMTKWDRIVRAGQPGGVIEFARRRAQDKKRVSLYSFMAGCRGTSNDEIRRWFDIPFFGTMGHEWVQFIGEDFTAYDIWLTFNPDRPLLLTDTTDTIKVGIPAAIKAFLKHLERIRAAGGKLGNRNDSGDLAYLTMEGFRRYNSVGLGEADTLNTNDLDEYLIEAIKEQVLRHCTEFGLLPDHTMRRLLWAVGTKGGVCWDQPALNGVQKITEVSELFIPSMKISDQPVKTSIPTFHRSAFIWQGRELICCLLYPARISEVKEGKLYRDGKVVNKITAIHPDDSSKQLEVEGYEAEARQHLVYDGDDFGPDYQPTTLDSVRELVARETGRLDWSHKRLQKPHIIKLSLVPELFKLRQKMIQQKVLRADFLR